MPGVPARKVWESRVILGMPRITRAPAKQLSVGRVVISATGCDDGGPAVCGGGPPRGVTGCPGRTSGSLRAGGARKFREDVVKRLLALTAVVAAALSGAGAASAAS